MANDLTHGITHHYLYEYVGATIFTQDSLNHTMTDMAFVNEMLHNSLSSLYLIFHEHKSFRI